MLDLNEDKLREQSIHCPPPEAAKAAIVRAFNALAAQKPHDQIYQELLDALSADWGPETIVIGHESLCGNLLRPFSGKTLYGPTSAMIGRLTQILHDIPLRFCFGIRNLATYIPSVYAEGVSHANLVPLADLTSRTVLFDLLWERMAAKMVEASQGQPVYFWRYEDYPYIWRNVIGALTGINNPQELIGDSENHGAGMSLWGAEELVKVMSSPETRPEGDFQGIAAKYRAENPSSEFEGGHPEWTDEIRSMLTTKYASDWYSIQTMPGVTPIIRQDFR
jgi:hypothetical protein